MEIWTFPLRLFVIRSPFCLLYNLPAYYTERPLDFSLLVRKANISVSNSTENIFKNSQGPAFHPSCRVARPLTIADYFISNVTNFDRHSNCRARSSVIPSPSHRGGGGHPCLHQLATSLRLEIARNYFGV